MTRTAIVIGGGIVGASVSYHLIKLGIKTTLYDDAREGNATTAAAGIISPETSHYKDPAWFQLALKSGMFYGPFIVELGLENRSNVYSKVGELTIALNANEIESYNNTRDLVNSRHLKYGYPASDEMYEIEPQEAKQYFPGIAPVKKAFYNKNAARIHGGELRDHIVQSANKKGLKIINETVDGLRMVEGKATGIISDTITEADYVIITGGAWSSLFAEQLDLKPFVEPQRGQIAQVKLLDLVDNNYCILRAFQGHYLVPWENGHFVIGATRELNSGFDPIKTIRGVQEVFREGIRVFPALENAELIEVKVGLRPRSIDDLPILGRVPNYENVILGTGMGPSGLQLGPYCGKILAELITGSKLIDISNFNIGRFSK
ncbi:MAG: FAD-binding oxidoreductase [Candidatus Heimdallarchaeota archaeon]|nr:FAD-binding oxidoreductase [Candidatus Heimdallarchaeota archaeon]